MSMTNPLASAPKGEPASLAPEVPTPEQTFETFMKKERERLTETRQAALEKRAEVDAAIAAIDTELSAIDAYEAAKHGKTPRSKKTGTRRSGRRAEVLAAVKRHPDGISRGDLLAAMGAKGDATEEQSISNALAALKRAAKVTAEDGMYKAV